MIARALTFASCNFARPPLALISAGRLNMLSLAPIIPNILMPAALLKAADLDTQSRLASCCLFVSDRVESNTNGTLSIALRTTASCCGVRLPTPANIRCCSGVPSPGLSRNVARCSCHTRALAFPFRLPTMTLRYAGGSAPISSSDCGSLSL